MDTLNSIDSLAQRAREEAPPNVDVSARVLMAIRARQASSRILPLSIVAAVSAVAAAVIVVVAVTALTGAADPMMELFVPLESVTI